MKPAAFVGKNARGSKMPKGLFLSALFLALGIVFVAGAAGGEGADQYGLEHMILSGGSQGDVPFPHALHQMVTGDCQVCHALFEKHNGSIAKAQEAGDLGKREVMRQCTTCHREARQAQKPHGPVSCNNCHNS
jgi:hypothetical protein